MFEDVDWARFDRAVRPAALRAEDILAAPDRSSTDIDGLSDDVLKWLWLKLTLSNGESPDGFVENVTKEVERRGLNAPADPIDPAVLQLASQVDGILRSALTARLKDDLALAENLVSDAMSKLSAAPTGLGGSSNLHLKDYSLNARQHVAELAQQKGDLAGFEEAHDSCLSLAREINALNPNDMLYLQRLQSYVHAVADLNPNKALQQVLPLTRRIKAGSGLKRAIVDALMAVIHADSSDMTAAKEWSDAAQEEFHAIGISMDDHLNPQGWIDAVTQQIEHVQGPVSGSTVLSLIAMSMARVSKVMARLHNDTDTSDARFGTLMAMINTMWQRIDALDRDAETFAADSAPIQPDNPAMPAVPEIKQNELALHRSLLRRRVAGEVSKDLADAFIAAAEGYADAPTVAIRCFQDAGEIYAELGDAEAAREAFEQALECAIAAGDLDAQVDIVLHLGFNAPEKFASPHAREAARGFIRRVEARRNHFTAAYLPSAFLANKTMPYHLAIIEAFKADDDDEMLRLMDYLKARESHCAPLWKDAAPDVFRAMTEISARRREAENEASESTVKHRRALWDEVMMSRNIAPPEFSLTALQDRLGNAALLTYFTLAPEVFLVIAITATKLLKKRVITDKIADYDIAFDAVANMENDSYGLQHRMAQLSDVFFPSEFHETLMTADQIIISAHRHLHRIPIHALPLQGEPMILGRPVGYVPNVGCLLGEVIARPQGRHLLALGAADGIDIDGRPTARLDNAEPEIETISELYKTSNCLTGKHASVRASAQHQDAFVSADVVHIALHGENVAKQELARAPMEVYLCAPDGTMDGIDVACWPLSAEVVYLSCCYAGRRAHSYGELDSLPGDALLGLQGALRFAGAEAVAAPLWQAHDGVAFFVSRAFHQSLAQGATVSEANHRSVAAYVARDDLRIRERDPCVWAQFVVLGFGPGTFGLKNRE